MLEILVQLAPWGIAVAIAIAAVLYVMHDATTRTFNEAVKGLARSGGNISADAIIDIYAGAREKPRAKFAPRDLASIEKLYLWVLASIAAEANPQLQVTKPRLQELQETVAELRRELKLLAIPESRTRIGQ